MPASAFFDAFKDNGLVLYNKEVNSAWGKGRCVEWSYLKLHPEFFADPPGTGSSTPTTAI
jgi:hypothetical protein